MKMLTMIMSVILLTACTSMGHKVASGINNSQLKGTVGKSYEQVMYEHPDFGKLIGRGHGPAVYRVVPSLVPATRQPIRGNR